MITKFLLTDNKKINSVHPYTHVYSNLSLQTKSGFHIITYIYLHDWNFPCNISCPISRNDSINQENSF